MFAAAPRSLLFNYPLAYLQYIAALLLSGDAYAVADGALRLDELQMVYMHLADIHPAYKNRILAEISTVRLFSVFNDEHQMMDCIYEALRLLDGGHVLPDNTAGRVYLRFPAFFVCLL